jgi:hypothetical protein
MSAKIMRNSIQKQQFTPEETGSINGLKDNQRIAFKSKAMGGHSVVILQKSQITNWNVFRGWFGFGPLAGLKYSLADVVDCLKKYNIEALYDSKEIETIGMCRKIREIMQKHMNRKSGIHVKDLTERSPLFKQYQDYEANLVRLETYYLTPDSSSFLPDIDDLESFQSKIKEFQKERNKCRNLDQWDQNLRKRASHINGRPAGEYFLMEELGRRVSDVEGSGSDSDEFEHIHDCFAEELGFFTVD